MHNGKVTGDNETTATEGTETPDRVGQIGKHRPTEWRSRGGKWAAEKHHRIAQRIGPRKTFIAANVLGFAVIAGATSLGAVIYDGVQGRTGIARVDHPALRTAKRLRSPAVNASAATIARAFGVWGGPLLAIVSGAALSLRDKKAAPFTLIGIAGAGSLAMTLLGKDTVRRNRPPRRDAIPPFEHSPSFPSGHTLNATTVVGAAAYLFALRRKRAGTEQATVATALGVIITVGLSRVLLGAHWFTDVMMGWVAGAGWLSSVITAHRLFESFHEKAERESTAA